MGMKPTIKVKYLIHSANNAQQWRKANLNEKIPEYVGFLKMVGNLNILF